MSNPIEKCDPEAWQILGAERRRQQEGLEMIASENYASAGCDGGPGHRVDQ